MTRLRELAQNAIAILKERGDAGIESAELARLLGIKEKRRVYDIVAVLSALDFVHTVRRQSGTRITWVDPYSDYVPRVEFEELQQALDAESAARRKLQVQAAELKERLRVAVSRLGREARATQLSGKYEFETKCIRVRPTTGTGFVRVRDSGMEVLIETREPGMVVDPTEPESDDAQTIIEAVQRS